MTAIDPQGGVQSIRLPYRPIIGLGEGAIVKVGHGLFAEVVSASVEKRHGETGVYLYVQPVPASEVLARWGEYAVDVLTLPGEDVATPGLSLVAAGSDTFAYADGPLGAPWMAWTDAMPDVASGMAVQPGGNFGDASYSVATDGPDCYAEAILQGAPAHGVPVGFGLAVRLTAHSGAANGYMMEMRDLGAGWGATLYRGATFTPLALSALANYADVDGLRLMAVGSAITGYLRVGGAWTEVVSAVDATYQSAGYPGFWVQKFGGADFGVTDVSWGTVAREIVEEVRL